MYKQEIFKCDPCLEYCRFMRDSADIKMDLSDEERGFRVRRAQELFMQSEAVNVDPQTPEAQMNAFYTLNEMSERVHDVIQDYDHVRLAHTMYNKPHKPTEFEADGFYFLSRASLTKLKSDGSASLNQDVKLYSRGLLTNGFVYVLLEQLCEENEMADVVISFAAQLLFTKFYGPLISNQLSIHDMLQIPAPDIFSALSKAITKNTTSVGDFDVTLATMLILIAARLNQKNPNDASIIDLKRIDEILEAKNSPTRRALIESVIKNVLNFNGLLKRAPESTEVALKFVKDVVLRFVEFDVPDSTDTMLKDLNIKPGNQ